MPWKVPAATWSRTPSWASRVPSWPAARRVKVRASTWRGSAVPRATRQAMRRVRALVLPDPAPARMQSGAASLVTASVWDGLGPASRSGPATWGTRTSLLMTRLTVPRGYDRRVDGRRASAVGRGGPIPGPGPGRGAAPSSLRAGALRTSRGRTLWPLPPFPAEPTFTDFVGSQPAVGGLWPPEPGIGNRTLPVSRDHAPFPRPRQGPFAVAPGR